jgi:hypothetical protein
MRPANEAVTRTARHCAYCGHALADDTPVIERFGEPFCSEPHAKEFTEGVRAARIQAAARSDAPGSACALSPAGQSGRRNLLKRAACWGAPVLLLLAIPLIWSGGWAAAGGSLLSVLALLACPLGMYFMMRSMGSMQQQHSASEAERGKENHRA